ncbi:MAG TPA: pyridoxamine 5'-phosphate oxidase family protein [Candidatus Limnocylindrales bacterium]|nr:pyridoxamine 5'-phosphate oxidase family protein [Candidatus Limnocylindrales bacterium]
MDIINLAEPYDLPPVDWQRIVSELDRGITQKPDAGGPNRFTTWLTTLNADGSPNVTAVGALWVDGTFWFQTGEKTRKGRNLARDPRCAMSVSTHDFDLVVEGAASLVEDPDAVRAMVERWVEGGWPVEVDESGIALTAPYSAPSAGPPPWRVYRVEPSGATALVSAEPGGATRWRF